VQAEPFPIMPLAPLQPQPGLAAPNMAIPGMPPPMHMPMMPDPNMWGMQAPFPQQGWPPPQMPWPPAMPFEQQQMPNQRVVSALPPTNQLNIKKPQFPDFSDPARKGPPSSGNIGLLMSVPLDVSIVIGKTKRKVKEILDFGQGTVLELEKQTGAPAEIIVNGQLLAYGDVIVIGDNYGVRITEIVGTKELMDSLS